MKESGTECSHVCSFAVFSRVVIESRVRESWSRARVERSRKRIENRE